MENAVMGVCGGSPPPQYVQGRRTKWSALHWELDNLEIGVWASMTATDEKTAKSAIQSAKKYLRPRNIGAHSAIEPKAGKVVLWLKKVDLNAP